MKLLLLLLQELYSLQRLAQALLSPYENEKKLSEEIVDERSRNRCERERNLREVAEPVLQLLGHVVESISCLLMRIVQ